MGNFLVYSGDIVADSYTTQIKEGIEVKLPSKIAHGRKTRYKKKQSAVS